MYEGTGGLEVVFSIHYYTVYSIQYCTVKAIECGQDIHYSGLVSVYNYIHNYINNLSIFLDQTNNLLDSLKIF